MVIEVRNMQILVQKDGETFGPFEEQEVLAKVENGEFCESDLAMTDGLQDWTPLGAIIVREPIPPTFAETIATCFAFGRNAAGRVRMLFTGSPLAAAIVSLIAGCIVLVLSRWPVVLFGPFIVATFIAGFMMVLRQRVKSAFLVFVAAIVLPAILWMRVFSSGSQNKIHTDALVANPTPPPVSRAVALEPEMNKPAQQIEMEAAHPDANKLAQPVLAPPDHVVLPVKPKADAVPMPDANKLAQPVLAPQPDHVILPVKPKADAAQIPVVMGKVPPPMVPAIAHPNNQAVPPPGPVNIEKPKGEQNKPADQQKAKPPSGISLARDWDSPLQGNSATMKDLGILLAGFVKPKVSTGLSPDIKIFQGISYLMPFVEARRILNIPGSSSASRNKVVCPGFPKDSFFYVRFDGTFEGHYNQLYMVLDKADQVVSVQLVDEKPRKDKDHEYFAFNGDWHTYNFINMRTRATPKLSISHKVTFTIDGDVWYQSSSGGSLMEKEKGSQLFRIDSLLVESNGHSTYDWKPLQSVRWYLPRPVAELSLYYINKSGSR